MFDLVVGRSQHLPRHAAVPMLTSTALQVLIVGTALVLPLLYVTDRLPEARSVMVFILEAIVDRDGTVSDVKVLRSVDRLLDAEAVRALRQLRYSPLVLNGAPERFVLTVTLTFRLGGDTGGTS